MLHRLSTLTALLSLTAPTLLGAQFAATRGSDPAPQCRAGTRVAPSELLDRSLDVMGVRAAGGRVLFIRSRESSSAREQSDRSYPPYLDAIYERRTWFDPQANVERHEFDSVWPGVNNRGNVLVSPASAFAVQDTLMRPAGAAGLSFVRPSRLLNPWSVVLEWRADSTVRYESECIYRDYWRVVLRREAIEGTERLFIDGRTGFPIKLEYDEPHYLWGQMHVEYVYATWKAPKGGGSYPGSAARIEDGEVVVNRTISGSEIALVARDSTPRLALPPNAPNMRERKSTSFAGSADVPDTVRVGPQTYLLVTRAYTQTVALLRDTVYILDATTGEQRARQDSIWIAKLFPGRHPLVVVVTDIAWPHIAGVRFWAARGASIVTHRASESFLRRVTAQRWTLTPDALESNKAPRGAQLRVRAIMDSVSLAGGALKLYPIDGPGSEGALVAFLPNDRYLWASDYVQRVDRPSQYTTEVLAAVRRAGLTPDRFAAQHVPLTAFSVLTSLPAP